MSDPKRLAEHIAALLIDHARGDKQGHRKGVFVDEFVAELSSAYEIDCPNALVFAALEILKDLNAVEVLHSPLTDDVIEVNFSSARKYFYDDEPYDPDDWDFGDLQTKFRAKYPVLRTYFQAGDRWVDRVTGVLSEMDMDREFGAEIPPESEVPIPAADRIVSLTDNQIKVIDSVSAELSEKLGLENSIEGDPALRDRFLAQIAACRELIRAGSVRAFLIYETIVRALLILVEKYKDHAIGATAKKLLDLFIDHILSK